MVEADLQVNWNKNVGKAIKRGDDTLARIIMHPWFFWKKMHGYLSQTLLFLKGHQIMNILVHFEECPDIWSGSKCRFPDISWDFDYLDDILVQGFWYLVMWLFQKRAWQPISNLVPMKPAFKDEQFGVSYVDAPAIASVLLKCPLPS